MFRTATFAAIAASLAITAAAHAEAPSLSYGDLDLNTEAGKAELAKRIDRTARAICAQGVETGTLIAGRHNAKCVADNRAALTAQVTRKVEGTAMGG